MKEHPILFSGPMIRAILEGRKLQTRRVVTTTRSWIKFYGGDKTAATKAFHEDASIWNCGGEDGNHWQESDEWTLQNYQEQDRLWVRETWAKLSCANEEPCFDCQNCRDGRVFRADNDIDIKWKPSIFMPKWASRITLEITQVRVQRLQDIITLGLHQREETPMVGKPLGLGDLVPQIMTTDLRSTCLRFEQHCDECKKVSGTGQRERQPIQDWLLHGPTTSSLR